jgi:predicted outer membrane repeat protein
VITVLSSAAWGQSTWFVNDDNCPGPGSGTPDDPFCSIQGAIDAAADTDEIIVAPGTYFETINLLGKAITLRSAGGPEVTTIDGQASGSVVTCNGNEGPDTVLDGFTITNGANSLGGGMFNSSSSPTVTNCTFSANTAVVAGGGMFNSYASPTVTNCTFSANTAVDAGGGMYNFAYSDPAVTNCTFSDNAVDFEGGGMFNSEYSNPTVTGCRFISNGTAQAGGGMFNAALTNPIVTNCLFSANGADYWGGGMYNEAGSNVTVTNCTFNGNSADETGGAIYNEGCRGTTVTNCILWINFPDEFNSGGILTVSYSDVPCCCPGLGNINAYPMYVDPANGDFRLSPGSPCIDAGLTSAVPVGITTDLDGYPRCVDDPDTPDCQQAPDTCGEPPVVDMGACEFQPPPPCLWDCGGDNNDNVGVIDFLVLLGQWGQPGSCDFDGGGVGITDLLALLGMWGPCP